MNETMNYFMVNFLPIVAIFALFWFLLIRPQKKRENTSCQAYRGGIDYETT